MILRLHLPSEKQAEMFKFIDEARSALEAATVIAAANHEDDLDNELSLIDYQVQDLMKKIR
jgi:hypothetical protein